MHHLQSRVIEDKVRMLDRMYIDRQTYQSSIMMDYSLLIIDVLKKYYNYEGYTYPEIQTKCDYIEMLGLKY